MKLPRFTLRELFLLGLVVAMGVGWVVNRESLILQRDQQIEVREHLLDDWQRDEIRRRKVEAFLEGLGYEVKTSEDGEIQVVKSDSP
jgi:hypothetical protein